MHFLTAPVRNNCQKHSQKPFQRRFNTALEASLQAWQQKHHAVILVSPAVVQGLRDITREIQQDIAWRMRAEP
ncbi:conjugal transfer protein TrbI [Klebsiella pneumoniae]|uniref:Conjugal transfer protein TrbI n=1 Tax=Klebsiella pneumoniae TaxID=573 RepID=A0A2X1QKM9_KLEPN|nr:conjugal transfer protein TrbI [Klebsiella pneumoniae]